MDEKSPVTDQMPQTIGRYKVQESIGYGAMGAVYKAFDPLIKRTLAIKAIRLDIPKGSPQYGSFKERFYSEARAVGNLSHPNIVVLFDIGEEGGQPYLVMEYVEGETIAALLERGTRFKPEMVVTIASQIASGLDHAHSEGIVHRDIKPSNLMLSAGDKVKITDFGIARELAAEMTQSGVLLGTPSYMSPEQAMGDKVDGRSDIFSLGVCCFEMLSGEQPFPGNNVTSILYKLVHVPPIEPANLEMHGLVPQKWHEVFGKVLAKKPADRYQTAGAFVHDLEFCLGTWFASLGIEDTITEILPTLEATAPSRKITVAAMAAAPAEATVPMPVLAASPPSTSARMEPRPGAPGGVADEIEATVVLNAPPLPAVSKKPTAAAATDDSATVVLKAPPPARVTLPPPPEIEATVVLAPPELTMAAEAARPPAPSSRAAPAVPKARVVPEAAPTMPAASRPAVRAGIPASVIVGGAALVFALALTIAGVVFWKKMGAEPRVAATPAATVATTSLPPATEPPPAVPAAALGSLHVETLPGGAAIAINGEVKGTTPLDLTGLPPGSYELKIELKGYEARTQTVAITTEAPRAEVSLALARAAAVTGTADILSTPFGAAVTVDGSKVGLTPLSEFRIRPGTHRVELSKEGYEPWSGTLVVAAGQKGRLDVPLKPKPVVPAPPVADTPDPNRIYANTAAEVDTPAKKASGESVSYPDGSPRLKSGESVSVRVSFVVTESGDVTDARIVESGGKILDDAVLSTIRTWRYQPAVKKGTRVKVRLELRQTFRAG